MISTICHNKSTPQSISRERETVYKCRPTEVCLQSPRVRGGCDVNNMETFVTQGLRPPGHSGHNMCVMCDESAVARYYSGDRLWGPRTAADAGSGSGPVSAHRRLQSHWLWTGPGRGDLRPGRGDRDQGAAVSVRPAPGAVLRHDMQWWSLVTSDQWEWSEW